MSSNEKDLLLGIDFGSGGCKATVIDCSGNLAGEAAVEYPTHYPHPGWSEQNPADWYDAMCKALAKLRENGVDTEKQVFFFRHAYFTQSCAGSLAEIRPRLTFPHMVHR